MARKRALEQGDLQRQLKMYRELVGLAVDAILTGDTQGNFVSANKSAIELTGYPIDELAQMNIADLFSAQEHERVPLRFDLLQKGEIVVTERNLSRKDGSSVPIEMKSRMLSDGTYHAFIRDLTERRQAEEALRVSEEKFSRAFRLCPDAINITRMRDATFIEVNEGFSKLIGWSKEEVIGRSALPGDLNIWVNEAEREQLAKGLQEQGEVIGQPISLRRKDGFVGVGLTSARVIEIGGELCILAITRDITEQEELRRQKEQLEEQLLQAQKLESLGVLAGGIAHDFNNILMAVLGHCELAQRRLASDSPVRQNLEQIRFSVNQAADLAGQMLAYSGKGQFVIELSDLSTLVADLEQMLSVSVNKKARLVFDLKADLPCIEGDLTQLRQIVLNLVINASDALNDTPGVIRISTGVCDCREADHYLIGSDQFLPAGPYLYLEVADNGCGMDDETRQRIFDPFFSTKFTGRGLGMAAVFGIVRGHQGSLEIETRLGQGTRIRVLLPASEKKVENLTTAEIPKTGQMSGLVLLADDDPAVLAIGEAMLEELGFSVVTAMDGEEVLALFRSQQDQFRFVLLDLTMPRMGGEEAFERLRQMNPDLPIIISSGFNEQEMSAGFMQSGQVCFLKKPYQLEQLQRVIQTLTPF